MNGQMNNALEIRPTFWRISILEVRALLKSGLDTTKLNFVFDFALDKFRKVSRKKLFYIICIYFLLFQIKV